MFERAINQSQVNLQGLLLASIIIGTLGIGRCHCDASLRSVEVTESEPDLRMSS